ncbi:MAG: hypothetical protein AAF585_01900 [Verrucomicrobiota bacterium]
MKLQLTTLVLAGSFITGAALADDKGHSHDHEHDHGGHHHATIVVPTDLAALWAKINAYAKVVADSAAAGDMDTLHKEQVNLEALVGGLANASGNLDDRKKKRVEGMIGNAQRALGKLHEETDADDTKGVAKAAKSLTGVLMLLKKQYPDEVTSGMAEVKDDLGPHDGMLADFDGGRVELKLHDDKGDLELWLTTTEGKPFDLPAAAKITVAFEDAKEESVMLAVRNNDKNENEDGEPTMRDGKTNYFIFPGDTGADASWLKGADFKAQVTVTFDGGSTDKFLLIPHTQSHGHGHDH